MVVSVVMLGGKHAARRLLRVEATVTIDGQRPCSVRDDTFPGPGAVGAWAEADSVTEFKQLEQGAA